MPLAKDVVPVEADFVSLLQHMPGDKGGKQQFFNSRGIRVPHTSYEQMWNALTRRLHHSGAASAVFDLLQTQMSKRLAELMRTARRGNRVSVRSSDHAVVFDLFFQNGNLRRTGELLLEHLQGKGIPISRGIQRSERPTRSVKSYEIALSFAGENRGFVEAVAQGLRDMGARVFYDAFEKVDLLGKDLVAHFGEIYRKRADYCAMFISRDYVRKAWPNLERQHAQARALAEKREYILPIRLDDSEVPGLSPTIGYVDARSSTPLALARILFKKIRG